MIGPFLIFSPLIALLGPIFRTVPIIMLIKQYFGPYTGPSRRFTGANFHPYPIFYGTPNMPILTIFSKIYDPMTAFELKMNIRMQLYDMYYA